MITWLNSKEIEYIVHKVYHIEEIYLNYKGYLVVKEISYRQSLLEPPHTCTIYRKLSTLIDIL